MSDTGRYHISWKWGKTGKGHIITAERLSDGKLRFYDPQTGKLASYPLKNIDTLKGFKILRVDNLRANPDVVKYVVKKAGTSGNAPMMDKAMREWWKGNTEGYGVTGENKITKKDKRDKIKNEAKTLFSYKPLTHSAFNQPIYVHTSSIKEWLNQPYKDYDAKNEFLLQLHEKFPLSSYIGKTNHKIRKGVKNSHIFETKINDNAAWIIVHEMEWGEFKLHSISDAMRDIVKEIKRED